jgi:hypothetical protein
VRITWASKSGKISSLLDPESRKMAYARKFRVFQNSNPNLKTNNLFWEFYDALLGDGCISRFKGAVSELQRL